MLKSISKTTSCLDYFLLGASFLLISLGILILASVSAPFSQKKFGITYYYLEHQILFGLLPGLFLAFLAFRLKTNFLKKWSALFLLINLILLSMVFLPGIGLKSGGAARWLAIGKWTFQPSEFLKITFILYLAAWLSNRTGRENTVGKNGKNRNADFSKTLIAFLIVIGTISLFLALQPDVSTLGIIILVAIIMYFLAKTPFWHLLLIILIGISVLFFLIEFEPYRKDRLSIFLSPGLDPLGKGYQISQSIMSIGSGGIFGSGLGMSGQKFGFLPIVVSDAIFAIFAEETGFIGALILISLYLIFFWRAFQIGSKTSDKFSQLTAFGIGSWIIIQAFVNIGSMISLLPLTGIPLPFISYGGSALISQLIGIGILLNISKGPR